MNKKIEIKMYPLEKLELNEGQLKGLGKNPRYIKEGEFEKTSTMKIKRYKELSK